MKTLLLLFLLTCNNLCITTTSTDTVYICDSSGAKKYHLRRNCKGLQNCQQKIIKITLDQATRRGRTLCGYEK